jgi:putative nucleotidyltransferase with HDIG domain
MGARYHPFLRHDAEIQACVIQMGMSGIKSPKGPQVPPTQLGRRMAQAADLAGNADGVASQSELKAISGTGAKKALSKVDGLSFQRAKEVDALIHSAGSESLATLDPQLKVLPPAMRRLALELDGLWGNSDGQLSAQEFERVAGYYLAALPFYFDDAQALLELADFLKLDDAGAPPAAQSSVLQLRLAVANADGAEVTEARPYRALLEEAIAEAEVPGAPGLLRDMVSHRPRYHRLSVLEHTASAVKAARAIAAEAGGDWRLAGATLLLHDIGKVLDRHARDDHDPGYSFFDHEGAGARWLRDRGVDPELVFQVKNHAMVRHSTADELRALAGGDQKRLGHMMLVYLSDQVAKGDTEGNMQSLSEQRPKVIALANEAGLDGARLFDFALDQIKSGAWRPD